MQKIIYALALCLLSSFAFAVDYTGAIQYTYADADGGPTQINTTEVTNIKATFENSIGLDIGTVVAHTVTDQKVTDYGWDTGVSYKYRFLGFLETTRVGYRQINVYNGAVQYEQQEASITGHINSWRYSEELNYRIGIFRPYISYELVETDTVGQGIKYVRGHIDPNTGITTVKFLTNTVNAKSSSDVYGIGSDFFVDQKFSFRIGYSHSEGSALYGSGRNFDTFLFGIKYRFNK